MRSWYTATAPYPAKQYCSYISTTYFLRLASSCCAFVLTGAGDFILLIRRPGIWKVGRIAASVAAYALALNVMLTSALLASISPLQFNALHELCFNSAPTQLDAADDGDRTAAPVIHCPLCLSPAAMALPPEAPAIATRIVVPAPLRAAPYDIVVAQPASSNHQARGPPHLT